MCVPGTYSTLRHWWPLSFARGEETHPPGGHNFELRRNIGGQCSSEEPQAPDRILVDGLLIFLFLMVAVAAI